MDPDVFDDFYEHAYGRQVRALALVTGDADVARDAVDEALARAWEQLKRGRVIDLLEAWVRTVALNVARRRTSVRDGFGERGNYRKWLLVLWRGGHRRGRERSVPAAAAGKRRTCHQSVEGVYDSRYLGSCDATHASSAGPLSNEQINA